MLYEVITITQSYGSGDAARTGRIVEQTVVFKALVAIVAALALDLFLEPLVRFFSDDPEVLSYNFV